MNRRLSQTSWQRAGEMLQTGIRPGTTASISCGLAIFSGFRNIIADASFTMPIVLHVSIESKRAIKPIPSCDDASARRHKKTNVSDEVKDLCEINGRCSVSRNSVFRSFRLADCFDKDYFLYAHSSSPQSLIAASCQRKNERTISPVNIILDSPAFHILPAPIIGPRTST